MRASDGKELFVPYCDDCFDHALSVRTRRLATTLASCLLSLSLALFSPFLLERQPLPLLVLLVLLGALLPLGVASLLRSRARVHHSTGGRAVFFQGRSLLACTNREFGERLAALNGLTPRLAPVRESVLSPWMAAGILLGLAALIPFYYLQHPPLRVVNLGESRLLVLVDGRFVASVAPTSSENSRAGISLRVPAGKRLLVAKQPDGTIVFSSRVFFQAGKHHLFAPASLHQCFWLETTGYGRAEPLDPRIVALDGPVPFWALPLEVDVWFAQNPPPAKQDARSTGGLMTALRQVRCSEAPAEVRGAQVSTGTIGKPP
jgi:hypothetical protein